MVQYFIGLLRHTLSNCYAIGWPSGGVGYELGTLFKGLLGYGTFIFLFTAFIIFVVVYFNVTSLPKMHLFARKKVKKEDVYLGNQENNRANDAFDSESGLLSSKKNK